jgi:adenine C2-methylase RlmN of 23S rRNA A2503 and tRNA A37
MKKLGVFKDFTDDSEKSVFDVGNNRIIEMTLLYNRKNVDVVCVPTHHFCNLGCKMCHLTNNGLNKKMIPITIDWFLEALIETLLKAGERRTNKKKLLISFMGVGEPLLNIKLIREVYLNEDSIKKKLKYDEVSYSLSTMMPNNNIIELQEMVNELNMPLKIHFSLHSPLDKKRKDLIPNTTVSINNALNNLNNYRKTVQSNKLILEKYLKFHATNDPIEIHYTLINNVNDSDEELIELCNKLKQYNICIKFIRFNPINNLIISTKEDEWIKRL